MELCRPLIQAAWAAMCFVCTAHPMIDWARRLSKGDERDQVVGSRRRLRQPRHLLDTPHPGRHHRHQPGFPV